MNIQTITKENGFDFLTEEQYDQVMREAKIAFTSLSDQNDPYAFHKAFELALRRFTEMRDENEGEGDVLKRKLESFLTEAKRLSEIDADLSSLWLEKLVKEFVKESNLNLKFISGKLTAEKKNATLYKYLVRSLEKSMDVFHKEEGFMDEAIRNQEEIPERPPTGLRPRFIMLEDRLEEILSAVERYTKAGHYPPAEWLIEASQISQELSERDAGS